MTVPTPAPVDTPPADAPAAEPPKPTAPPVTPPAAPAPGDNLPTDPEALKAEIVRLRAENGKDRTAAKTQAADAAAKAARDELTQSIGKALGLIKDDEKLDPDKLASDLATERTAKREMQVELAVLKAAPGKGADAIKLLDRNSFTKTVAGLDPAADDFSSKVAKAIEDAIKNDPSLKASGQAPGASAVPAAGGSGEIGRPRVHGLGAAIEADRLASSTT